jgi:uncharacterized membrane protein YhaH (DUF805 family)
MSIAMGLVLSANPQMLAGGFYAMQSLMPLFIPTLFVLAGLVAGRAHDCGWPAWPIVALLAFVLLMVEVFARSVLGSPRDPFWRVGHSLPTALAAIRALGALTAWACMIALIFWPGRKRKKVWRPDQGTRIASAASLAAAGAGVAADR